MNANRYEQSLKREKIINKAIARALSKSDPDESVQALITYVGEAMEADRTYIFEIQGKHLDNTYEWCAPGIVPEIDELQNLEFDLYKVWLPAFKNHEDIVIRDMSEYEKIDPEMAEVLEPQGINQLITVPLFISNKFIGFVGIDNPPTEGMQEIVVLFEMLATFAASLLKNRDYTARLQHLSRTDAITQTYEMAYFTRQVNKIWQKKPDEKIIAFNIAYFHSYNDAYGVEQGNECLRQVGEILKDVFSSGMVANYSSDAFVVYYQGKDELEKIAEAHRRVLKLDPHFSLWLKAGIFKPLKGDKNIDIPSACDYAKLACEEVDNQSHTYYQYFSEELRLAIRRKRYLQENIDQAIMNGQIKIVYQPIIRSITGKVCSFEALCHWDDPVYGEISPNVFIPALEEKHLSFKLFEYIVNNAALFQHETEKAGREVLPVSINLTQADFRISNPFQVLEEAVNKYHLKRRSFCVEVTESMMIHNNDQIKRALNEFLNAGYEIWMDDFGSGYSSLNVLQNFPFSLIKLGSNFMKNFTAKSQKIVRATVNLAKNLGIQTLAEGVRNPEQSQFLTDIGCEKQQGTFFSRPLPKQEMQQWLKSNPKIEDDEERKMWLSVSAMPFKDHAFCIVFDSGRDFNPLYSTKSPMGEYSTDRETLRTILQRIMNDTLYPLAKKFRKQATLAESGQASTMEIVFANHYYMVNITQIAKTDRGSLLRMVVHDVTKQENAEEHLKIDDLLRNILNTYDCIYRVNFDTQTVGVVSSAYINEHPGDEFRRDTFGLFSRIHPKDRARLQYLNQFESLEKMIKQTGRGCYSDFVRIKDANGAYKWMNLMTLMIQDQDQRTCLLCIMPSSFEDTKDAGLLANMVLEDQLANRSNKELNTVTPDKLVLPSETKKAVEVLTQENAGQSDHEILTALATNFFAMFSVDLTNWKIRAISLPKIVTPYMIMDYKKMLPIYLEKNVQEDYRKSVGEFMDPATLSDRLSKDGNSSINYIGSTFGWCRIVAIPSKKDANGRVCHAVFIVVNINQEKILEQELDFQAEHDQLTRVLNRVGFERASQDLTKDKVPTAFVMLDVDHFKTYNDTYGHEVGDALLKNVAELLKKNFSSKDYVVRMGGDEFVVLVTEDSGNIEAIKDHLRSVSYSLGHPVSKGMPEASISSGIAVADEYTPNLYQKADEALYEIKKSVRGGIAVYGK